MATRHTHFNPEQFKETYQVRGTPINILSESGLGDLVGTKAQVHMHTPATKELGKPIYSVLVKGQVVGHTDDIYLKDTQMKTNKTELEKHRASSTGAKTRNTFVEGIVHPAPIEPADRELRIRPGSMTDAVTGADVSTGMSGTRLGPDGAKYK